MPGSLSTIVKLLTATTLVFGAAIVLAERRRPLRPRTQKEPDREIVNLLMGVGCAVAIAAVERPLVTPLARRAARDGPALCRGCLCQSGAGKWPALLLMDYTFYLWHILTHKVPFLWQFHLVHHIDLDLDASTALRFHALDMVISAPWRVAQVALIGLSPRALQIWQTFFFPFDPLPSFQLMLATTLGAPACPAF